MFLKFLKKLKSSSPTKEDIHLKTLLAKNILINNRKKYSKFNSINEAEEKFFSQNGEDGIIDFLLECMKINSPKFLEIGVEEYLECNTRLIYELRNSNGLIIDQKIDKKKLSNNLELWKGRLKVVEDSINHKNINDIINKYGFDKDLDLLSIDIDGIDYWVINELPEKFSKICIAEYNPVFGSKYEITVPNISNFNRTDYHYSNLCWGTSIKALINLMRKKKFIFLGTNSFKNNAFFVSNDYEKNFENILPTKTLDLDKFVNHKFMESRNNKKELTYLNNYKQLQEIKNCEIINLEKSNKEKIKIEELFKI